MNEYGYKYEVQYLPLSFVDAGTVDDHIPQSNIFYFLKREGRGTLCVRREKK